MSTLEGLVHLVDNPHPLCHTLEMIISVVCPKEFSGGEVSSVTCPSGVRLGKWSVDLALLLAAIPEVARDSAWDQVQSPFEGGQFPRLDTSQGFPTAFRKILGFN